MNSSCLLCPYCSRTVEVGNAYCSYCGRFITDLLVELDRNQIYQKGNLGALPFRILNLSGVELREATVDVKCPAFEFSVHGGEFNEGAANLKIKRLFPSAQKAPRIQARALESVGETYLFIFVEYETEDKVRRATFSHRTLILPDLNTVSSQIQINTIVKDIQDAYGVDLSPNISATQSVEEQKDAIRRQFTAMLDRERVWVPARLDECEERDKPPVRLRRCPRCENEVSLEETFECALCGERYCKERCWNDQYKACALCSDKISERSLRKNDYCRARLRFEDGRTVFLIAKEEVCFGKAKRRTKPEVDIVLRVLPVRSRKLDPENWHNSLKISGLHGVFSFHDGRFHYMCKGANGTYQVLENPPGCTAEYAPFGESMSDLDSLMEEPPSTGLEEEATPVEGISAKEGEPKTRAFPKETWVPLPGRCLLNVGQTGILQLQTRTCYDGEGSAALAIERVSNWTQHAYVQMVKRCTVGGDPGSAVFLEDSGVGIEAAAFLWDRHAFHIQRTGDADVMVDEKRLQAGEKVNLEEEAHITIGRIRFRFTTAKDEDFVHV